MKALEKLMPVLDYAFVEYKVEGNRLIIPLGNQQIVFTNTLSNYLDVEVIEEKK